MRSMSQLSQAFLGGALGNTLVRSLGTAMPTTRKSPDSLPRVGKRPPIRYPQRQVDKILRCCFRAGADGCDESDAPGGAGGKYDWRL
jgi:hypothetical protein